MAKRNSGCGASCTRRQFLQAATGTAVALTAPYFATARQRDASEDSDRILSDAESRIRRHRMAPVALKLLTPDGRPLGPGRRVEIRQVRHRFLFGCNIFMLGRYRTPEQNAAYESRFAGIFNYATLPFYWWNYERQKGRPDDARTEGIVRWCKAHDVTTKGHPLAWNYRDPPWLTGTPQEVARAQFERITRCVERFQRDIDIWDVVNEATHYDRAECKRDAPRLTEAIAAMGVGPYIRTAFKTARQAGPDATLVINDYRTDAAFAEKVVSELADEDARPMYDVIGIQSHMHGGPWGAARTWEVCERFAKFGKPLHFTETTLVSGPKSDSGWTTTDEGEEQQARLAAEFYTVLFSHPAVEAITWWDFSDQGAWQRAPAGFLRADMSAKPIYERLYDLIKGRWSTRVEVESGPEGRLKIDGFMGEYEVTVKENGRRLGGRFSLAKPTPEATEVQLTESLADR
uniref:endo-1,4-beta-xylanase n=1 Tax=uncultured microorganism TaxID=358574 RepID=A0A7U1GK75_9ZZZZ|nr:1,4-beta-xylanase [uncultured microorganism]